MNTKEKETVHIAMAFDDAFVSQACVTMASVISSTNSNQLAFHIFHHHVCETDLQLMKDWATSENCDLYVYTVPTERTSGLPIDRHASHANYLRLFVADALPPEIERFIYLDSDLIALEDVSPLYATPLKAKLFAARAFRAPQKMQKLGLPPQSPYLNSGVLLVNAKQWRQHGVTQQLLNIAANNRSKLEWWDQDLLALHSSGDFTPLNCKWNVVHQDVRGKNSIQGSHGCSIVHFSGAALKPWNSERHNPFFDTYKRIHDTLPSRLARLSFPWECRQDTPPKKSVIQQVRIRIKERLLKTRIQQWSIDKARANMETAKRELARKNELRQNDLLNRFAPERIVKTGPFSGLKYGNLKSVGSALLPKIAGTYESELHNTWQELSSNNYSSIFDVGCAEGYYAVGLARLFTTSHVHAYDISPRARQLCTQLSEINHVDDRVSVYSDFLPSSIADAINDPSEQSLIIMDVEGDEEELIKQLNSSVLRNCDIVVECHDFLRSGMTFRLQTILSESHNTTVIRSIGDVFKPFEYCPEFLSNASDDDRLDFLAEKRPSEMRWIVARTRSSAPTRII